MKNKTLVIPMLALTMLATAGCGDYEKESGEGPSIIARARDDGNAEAFAGASERP